MARAWGRKLPVSASWAAVRAPAKSPLGRRNRATSSREKAIRLRAEAPKAATPKLSPSPSTRPPAMAAGMLPRPPRTQAVKPLSPAWKPMDGEIWL